MKICILTIATNQYLQFVEKLYDDIEENFLNGHEINCLLFTDRIMLGFIILIMNLGPCQH